MRSDLSARHITLTTPKVKSIIARMAVALPKARKAKPATRKSKLEKAGPSLAKLKRLAKTRRPPQRWYDETENPFKATAKSKS